MATSNSSDPVNKRMPVITSVLTAPQWVAVFIALAVPASLVPFAAGFLLGLSVTRDAVFGAYALLSGLFADYVIRRKFRKVLVLTSSPRISFVALWVLLCLYVVFFTPFE